MGCGCGSGSKTADVKFVVTLPNRTTMEVSSEQAARAEVTRAGGGSYRRVAK